MLVTMHADLHAGQAFPTWTPSEPHSSLTDHEDKDGDVVMAEEEVEQLIESLQAARHDSREWDTAAGHATISMLLYGHQVGCYFSSLHLNNQHQQSQVQELTLLSQMNTCFRQAKTLLQKTMPFKQQSLQNNMHLW